MIKNILGVGVSIIFVLIIILSSEMLNKKINLKVEFTRKLIHIGVSNWWIIAMIVIEDINFAIVPPMIFIILNYMSNRKNIIKSMERNVGGSDLGTIYFPISLLILILLFWKNGILGDYKYIGAIGILIMGYGDGLAAVIGKSMGKIRYRALGNDKTIEGSVTMFITSLVLSFILLSMYRGFSIGTIKISIIISVIATLLEGLTPFGLDNITVPIFSSLVLYFIIDSNILGIINLLFSVSIGLIFSTVIAFGAYIKKSLSLSGSFGAVILGTGIFSTSGLYGSLIMIGFFITSSILSHYKRKNKIEVSKKYDKTGKRDIWQVFANGGVGLVYSILYFMTKESLFLIPFTISFATANSDTWATELGVLNKNKPISLRTFKRVEKGTSGAVSLFGTLWSLFGALFIGVSSILLIYILKVDILYLGYVRILIIITISGFIGGLIDSLIGATLQGVYYSNKYLRETEKRESNGESNRLIRGYNFFNNDVVNFISIGLSTMIFIFFI